MSSTIKQNWSIVEIDYRVTVTIHVLKYTETLQLTRHTVRYETWLKYTWLVEAVSSFIINPTGQQ